MKVNALFSMFLSEFISSNSRYNLDFQPVTDEEVWVLNNHNLPSYLTESAEAKDRHREAARGLVRKAFATGVFHLGEKELLRVWTQAAKKRRGGRKGSRKPDNDAALLFAYDAIVQSHSALAPKMPRLLGEYFHGSEQGRYGQSPSAIEKKLRRLLKQRREAEPFKQVLADSPFVTASSDLVVPSPSVGPGYDSDGHIDYVDKKPPT